MNWRKWKPSYQKKNVLPVGMPQSAGERLTGDAFKRWYTLGEFPRCWECGEKAMKGKLYRMRDLATGRPVKGVWVGECCRF